MSVDKMKKLFSKDVPTIELLSTEKGRMQLGCLEREKLLELLNRHSLPRRLLKLKFADSSKEISNDLTGPFGTFFNEKDRVCHTKQRIRSPYTFEFFAPGAFRLKYLTKENADRNIGSLFKQILTILQHSEEKNFLFLIEHTLEHTLKPQVVQLNSHENFSSWVDKCVRTVPNGKYNTFAFNLDTFEKLRGAPLDFPWVLSENIPDNQIYFFLDRPGVFNIRTDCVALMGDEPRQGRIGYVGYEEVSPVITNPECIFKATIT